jgi:hypothetical protein
MDKESQAPNPQADQHLDIALSATGLNNSDPLSLIRFQLNGMMLCLLAVTLCVAVFFGRITQLQYRTIKSQRPSVYEAMQVGVPRSQAVLREFQRYGAYDTNFAVTVLKKYGIPPAPSSNHVANP